MDTKLIRKLVFGTAIVAGLELLMWGISDAPPATPGRGWAVGGALFVFVWAGVFADHMGWIK